MAELTVPVADHGTGCGSPPSQAPGSKPKARFAEDVKPQTVGRCVDDEEREKPLRSQNTKGELFPGRARRPHNKFSAFDHQLSYRVYRTYEDLIGASWPLMVLELSGHGIPVIVGPLAALLGGWNTTPQNYQLLTNFVSGLLTDLLWSVALKPLVRRVRPYWHTQHQIATVETVDQYSFPSGHSARAVYMAAFAWHLAGIGSTAQWSARAMTAWAAALCASRVALGRHFIGDVLAGAAVGVANFRLVQHFWIQPEMAMRMRGAALSIFSSTAASVSQRL